MLDIFNNPETWAALATLIALEVVLGIDNIIFISILVDKLPAQQRAMARNLGLTLAMLSRIGLLFCLVWLMNLNQVLFHAFNHGFSGRDLILIIGGIFLLTKSVHEIHNSFDEHTESNTKTNASSMLSVLIQITLLDVVFSIDSVITAVGLVEELLVMIIAIIAAVGIMLVAAKSISEFVSQNPTIKMLALAFLILIGFSLIAQGTGTHVPKGYIYFAMAFSFTVEILNLQLKKRIKH